ncbi:MAG: methionyl-tRNA formyltransferase [Actinobacteria bacterium]|nr:methionyl-tRNA formyltransferase [Actinomycetota bacterium]
MRVLFIGGDSFCIPTLELLLGSGHDVVGILGKTEKPSGRGLQVTSSELTDKALELEIPYWRFPKLSEEEVSSDFCNTAWDIGVAVAYGGLVPRWILEKGPFGCICLHPSLLPRFRGAAPVERALMSGATVTGVTTFNMDEGYDTGDILLHAEAEINGYDTAGTLRDRLSYLGSKLVLESLDRINADEVVPIPQDESIASYAPPIRKEEGKIDWGFSAERIDRLVRALNPSPVAYTYFRGKRVKIYKTRVTDIPPEDEPGTIMEIGKEGFFVTTGTDCLEIKSLQIEGKNKMNASEFSRGQRLDIIERFNDGPQ